MKNYNIPFFLSYRDSDLSKGTSEVIQNILRFSCKRSNILFQDCAINSFKKILDNVEYFDQQVKRNSLSYKKTVHAYELVKFKFYKIEY
jgi:hypothetical protein